MARAADRSVTAKPNNGNLTASFLEEDFAMKGFLKYLTMSGAAAALIVGFTAGSARFAQAGSYSVRDADGASKGPTAAEPVKSSVLADLAGCWSGLEYGDIEDENYGEGYGWIGIDQKGSKIQGPKDASYYEFVWYDGGEYEWSYGGVKGMVKKQTFKATAQAGRKCKIKIVGGLSGDYIVGTYHSEHCKDFHALGTFELPIETDSYCYDIIP
jgi:hypothetical protein